MKIWTTAATFAFAAALTGGSAHAATLVGTFNGNDCSGAFGQGFANCMIPVSETYQNDLATPIIAKFEFNDAGQAGNPELNTALYPTITGDEWDFDVEGGTWTYVQGDGDPVIRFFAVKGGNAFNLFKMQPQDDEDQGIDFFTPDNPGGGAGLSHLTFYDTGGSDEPPDTAPEPTTLALLGLGLMGAGYARRRRR